MARQAPDDFWGPQFTGIQTARIGSQATKRRELYVSHIRQVPKIGIPVATKKPVTAE